MTGEESPADSTLWKIHDEWLVDDTRKLDLRLARVELPDGVHFEQYVLRMPKAAMTVVLDEGASRLVRPGGTLTGGKRPVSYARQRAEGEEMSSPDGQVSRMAGFQRRSGPVVTVRAIPTTSPGLSRRPGTASSAWSVAFAR